MKHRLILGLGVLAASPLLAFSPLDITAHAGRTPVVGCADFSGHWKGTCNVAGVVKSDEQEAVQDGCFALQVKNLRAPLGGTHTLIQTYPAAGRGTPFVSNTLTTAWDATRQIVRFTETVNNRNIGGLTADTAAVLTGEMKKRADGKLVFELFRLGKRIIFCEYGAE